MQRVPRLLPWLDQRQPDVVCGCAGGDIYVTREHPRFGWRPSANLGCSVNSPAEEARPVRVGHELYFSSTRTGNSDNLREPGVRPVDRHAGPGRRAQHAVRRTRGRSCVRTAGRSCLTPTARRGSARPTFGPLSGATRPRAGRIRSTSARRINSAAAETRPSLSADGAVLYFGSARGPSQDIYTSVRAG